MTTLEERLERLSPLQRALLALEEAQAKIDALERGRYEPVALVGIGCRFPGGVDGPESYWDLLRAGRHGVTEVPPDRWDVDALYDPDPDAPGKIYARHGGFIDGVDQFDALLFGISPREAMYMDPQQRLLLEISWEALERAGIAPDRLAGRAVGAFVGISTTDYLQRGAKHNDASEVTAWVGTGNAHSIAANRLSYVLGLEGPSLAVDTACSSSLVSVHLACASLRARECEVALAGAVNVMLLPETTMNFAKARMLSPEGRCKAFDARADGYVRGEGGGMVVLKRLSDAEAAGDRILAVIRGSAVNQDGRSNGLTAPHGPSQEEVIRRALEQAGVAPADVDYIEAHGTGTPLGDPIELSALARVLGRARDRPALVGSVKTNIGHLEAAAGMAGLIKAALAVDRGEVPPHLHFEEPNPHVPWESLPLRVTTEPQPFPAGRRIAGVSSFGFGGTNAHLVIEAGAAPRADPASDDAPPPAVLVKLAARGGDALAAAAARLRDRIAADPGVPLAGVARAACVGRADLPDRAAVVADSHDELVDQLDAVAARRDRAGVWRGRSTTGPRPRVAFLVPGQGARYGGAAAGLHRHEPAAARVLDELAEVLGPLDRLPLAALLEPGDDADRALGGTEVAQPALYALALAVAAWWRDAGIRPDALVGHSVGAYAAAALAGVMSAQDGARLVAARGRLIAELPSGGAMAAVMAGADDVAGALADLPALSIAAHNGAAETVVAGPREPLEALCARLEGDGVRTRVLDVSHAFHSPLVEPALPGLERELAAVDLSAPTALLVSDTTGKQAGTEAATPAYWLDHARQPVDFAGALSTIGALGCNQLIELGPGSTLLALARRHSATQDATALPSLNPRRAPSAQLRSSLGQAWTRGTPVDWERVPGPATRVVDIPTYPFQRRRHWIPEGPPRVAPAAASAPDGYQPPAAADPPEPEQPPAVAPAGPDDARTDLVASLLSRPAHERRPALVAHVRREVARVVGLAPDERIEGDQGLFDLGMDSLMAVELQRSLQEALGRELPVTLALDHPTLDALADRLIEELAGASTRPARRRRSARDREEPVAIVGMACRFPGGADDLDAYWRLLRDGVDAVDTIPPSRWDAHEFYDPDPDAPLRMNTRSGGFLRSAVDAFDADMFGISPREAASMDPQQRLLLEVAWEALEDAGLAGALAGTKTGVYVGINTTDYMQLLCAAGPQSIDAYAATGNTFSVAAGRLSYLLGLQGPSLAVDTACSSSLVALHLARQSLCDGESDAALVGGVNLMLSPATSIGLAKLRALAPDGRCKAFDAAADGYGRGEGCGVVVLKRLSDARAAGDPVWALVRGSAVNQDGRSAGLTVPNGPAQEAVIRAALTDAGVEGARVSYVEAHGTGTPLGDPIELQAVAAALGAERERPVAVGSVKTNIGHLEAAAGIAGVVKVALAMRHGQLPAHLHLTEPSPYVPWDALPIEVVRETAPWANGGPPRMAGVSSFGFSGTNAHVLLEEPREEGNAPAADRDDAAPPRAELLLVSARTEPALGGTARRFADLLGRRLDHSLEDVCFSAATRRPHHAHRMAVVARSAAEAADRLKAFEQAGVARGLRSGRALADDAPLVMAFCGQGAQWLGMGRGLLAAEPAFREAVERCDEEVRRAARWSPVAELRGSARLDDTEIAQPLIFAIQVGLAALWRSWGVTPSAVVGHSVGEVAAAHVAGALELDDAVRIVVERGRLMQETKGHGAMAALGLPPDELGELIEESRADVALAAFNGPSATVVAGAPDAVEDLVGAAARLQVFARRLPGHYAFHSPQMAPLRDRLSGALDGLAPRAPRLPIFSTVTGVEAGADDFGPDHWGAQIVAPVRFHDALSAATGEGHNVVLEIGPHPVLAAAIVQCLAADGRAGTPLASMRRDAEDERAAALDALGAMHVIGRPFAYGAPFRPGARVVSLPAYAWQRRRHWLPEARVERPGASRTGGDARVGGYALLHRRIESIRHGGEQLFEADLERGAVGALAEQEVAGAALLPAGVVLDAVLAAARVALPGGRYALRDVELDESLLPEAGAVTLHLTLGSDGGFEAFARTDSETRRIAAGAVDSSVRPADPAPAERPAAIRARLTSAGDDLWRGPGEALARLRADGATRAGAHIAHPSLLQAALELALPRGARPLVPVGVTALSVDGHLPDEVWAHAARDGVRLLDDTGRIRGQLDGVRFGRVADSTLRGAADRRLKDLTYRFEWRPSPRPEPRAAAPRTGSWLLLADEGGVAAEISAALEARGERCVLVRSSEAGEPGAAARWIDEATAGGAPPLRGVVHLWALDACGDGLEAIRATVRRECGGLLHVVQALTGRGADEPPRIWIATRGAQPVASDDPPPVVARAPLCGLSRVVALEHPDLWGGLVDLDAASGSDAAALLIDEIWAPDEEDQVAYRAGERHVARLVSAPLESASQELRLRSDAAYLITGGRGALGLKVAAWMAERGARHLVLAGRRPPDESATAAIDALREAGATIHAPLADVANRADMDALLHGDDRPWPAIRGIVHAAGLFRPQTTGKLDLDELDEALAPKVDGSWILHELTSGDELDFLVMFSSAASVWGSALAAAYVAANHFEDVLAHYRRALGQPALAVNWGWWDGSDMVPAEAKAYFGALGLEMIPEELGFAALERLMLGPEVQCTVAPVDWRRFKAAFSAKRRRPLLDLIEAPEAPAEGPAVSAEGVELIGRLRAAPVGARHALMVEFLQRKVGAVLGRGDADLLDPELGFFEAGMDSITTVELKTRLEAGLGVVLPATVAFERPNIASLADYLVDETLGASGVADAPSAEGNGHARELEHLSEDELLELLAQEAEAGP